MLARISLFVLVLSIAPRVFASTSFYYEDGGDRYTNYGIKYTFTKDCKSTYCVNMAGSVNVSRVYGYTYPNAYGHATLYLFPQAVMQPYAGISIDAGEALALLLLLDGSDASVLPQVDMQLSWGVRLMLSPTLSINSYYKQSYLSGYYVATDRYDSYGISITYNLHQ